MIDSGSAGREMRVRPGDPNGRPAFAFDLGALWSHHGRMATTFANELNAVYEAGALGREHAAILVKKLGKALRSNPELALRVARAYTAALIHAVDSMIPGGASR